LGGLVAIKTLVTFGDSWPAGAELQNGEHPFGQLLADQLGCNFVNCAEPATAIDNLIFQLDNYIKSSKIHNTMAVFFLTDLSRAVVYKDKKLCQVQPLYEDRWYLQYMYSEELSAFRANVAVLALQRMCAVAGIEDRYVMGWTRFPIMFSGIDLNKIYDNGRTTCLNLFGGEDGDTNYIYHKDNHYIRPNQDHPNQVGHKFIADTLYKWIK
jgi:hypothetical protein